MDPINHDVLRAAFLAGRTDALWEQQTASDQVSRKDLETALEMVLGNANVTILAKIAKNLWREKVERDT
jgi:hypothetical protein